MSLLAFLEERVRSWLDTPGWTPEHRDFFGCMLQAITSANVFMKTIYHAALWLTSEERDILLDSGYACVRAFHRCARKSYNLGLTRWKYQQKFHMFGELLYSLQFERRQSFPSLSPLTFCTQQDEDFVGRVSFFSRTVSVRTVHIRTLGRYQIALGTRW